MKKMFLVIVLALIVAQTARARFQRDDLQKAANLAAAAGSSQVEVLNRAPAQVSVNASEPASSLSR